MLKKNLIRTVHSFTFLMCAALFCWPDMSSSPLGDEEVCGRKFKSCIAEIPTLTFVAVYSASHDSQNIGTLLYCFDVRQFRKPDGRRRMTLGIRRRRTGCIETRHIESYSLNHCAFVLKKKFS
ncbi:hypothetical protein F2Y83_29210 [Bacteroides cellulosilyticus]|uniref:hypothetical protein n=1 Tax=Bacteroides cellulosilyticus TaxID=246787 RepID=UPI001230B39B|nr:hypothetical protein [Bacteroides cellulosilyticus]KAA5425934.1 hypothetical protein F2Y70_11805 [Bacteroides cellulosilyticus]KAA5426161.1 hypothetical protein F2Y83_29210 [Bacteroides cellulosilyticus]KAA5431429.1 hypothetical protein F2Y74_23450 [Bacteroides cellulosilyticus]KAA5445328.1 hypothetical protein F2Y53_16225 [Bacteroides cellulosilyticus]